MLEFARLRPVRGIRGARPVPRQGTRVVFFPVEIMCFEDGALEGAERGILCRWRGRCGRCAEGRMDGRVDSDRYRGVGGWEEEDEDR
jgi:hypothetical protein